MLILKKFRHDELTLTLKSVLKLIEEQRKSLSKDVKDKEEQEVLL